MKRLLVGLALVILLSSCASHTFMRGTVAMKTDKKTAYVCLGDNDVKVGDKISFYTNQCTGVGGRKEGDDESRCEMKVLGKGTVTKLLNSHYSEVVTDGSFKLKEGILVQKQ